MPRIRIGKQTELSSAQHSIVKTDAANEQMYLAPGANGDLLTIVAGVPTWQAPVIPSEFDQYANFAAFPVVGSLDVIYLDIAGNVFYIWDGAAYVQVPTAAAFSITGAGNSGPNQAITNGQTFNILGANGFTVVASATRNFTVTPPTGAVTGQVLTWNNGTSTWSAITPGTTFLVAADAGAAQTITIGTDTLTIIGGTNISTVTSATDNVTVNMDPFSIDFLSDVDVTTTPPGVGDYLAWDGTNFAPVTPAGGFTSWTLAGDAGVNQTISDSNTATFIGGAGITTTGSAGDNLTIAYDGTLNNNSDVNITAAAVNEILVFDGTDWVDTNGCTWLGNFSLDCFSDVVLTAPANGQILTYNGTNWVNLAPVANFITAVTDTNTVDLTVGAGSLSADVLFSVTAGNVAHNVTGVAAILRTEYFTPANGDTTVTIATAPLAGTAVHVYINGERAPITTEWSIAGTVITFVTAFAPSAGAQYSGTVTVDYWI